MSDVIYTVEHGEYSDHSIDAFCTTLEDAKRCAQRVWDDRWAQRQEYDRKNSNHPSIYANPINEVDGKATAVEWEPTNE